ncbi:hypothetical protein Tco_0352794 [Tanacetum coccineum]
MISIERMMWMLGQMCMCSATVAGNAVTTAMAITCSIHQAKIWATKGLLDKAKGNVLGMEIVKDQSGNTLRVSQSRIDQEEVFVVRFFWKEQEGSILFGLPGSRQQKFDCLGPRQGVEDLRELLHKGAQGDHEAKVFQVSNDDTAVAQRWLEDKQPEEKTNTDYLVKEQEKEYQTVWKIKTGNVLSSLSKVFWAEDTTSWLASIKQGMLEPVKVKCILLGYHKSMVGNKLWRLDDVNSKVVLYRNMGFNESGEYKKTFIGSGVGKGSMQVLHGFEFEVEPLRDHTFEVEPQENVDQGAGLQEVQTQDLMDYQLARDREQHLACELFGYREDIACEVISKWKAGLKDDMDARLDVYVLSNGCRCKAEIWATKGLLDKAKGNVLGMKIVRDQSGNTLRVSQSRYYNGKLVQTLFFQPVCSPPHLYKRR